MRQKLIEVSHRVGGDPRDSINRALSSTAHVLIEDQQLEIMDWSPNLTLTNPGQWQFDRTDLAKLCVKNSCH